MWRAAAIRSRKVSRLDESTVCDERPFQRWMLSGKEFWYSDHLASGTKSHVMTSYVYCVDQQVCVDDYLSLHDAIHPNTRGLDSSLT